MAHHTKIDSDGNPNVFNLNSNGEQLKLNANNAKPDMHWNSDNHWVFSARNYALFTRLDHKSRFFLSGLSRFLYHAPSIRPASISILDKSVYLPLGIIFAS